MPIYAYKCGSCGFAKDVLQKLSDAPLSVCPECSAAAFTKQVTAAGFQLKGSGWYVTDFRGGSKDQAASGAVGGVESKASSSDSAASGATGAGAGAGAGSSPTSAASSTSSTSSSSATSPASSSSSSSTSGSSSSGASSTPSA